MEWLSARHQTVWVQKTTLHLYRRNVPLLHMSRYVTAHEQFHQAHIGTASNTLWGEKAWVHAAATMHVMFHMSMDDRCKLMYHGCYIWHRDVVDFEHRPIQEVDVTYVSPVEAIALRSKYNQAINVLVIIKSWSRDQDESWATKINRSTNILRY